MKRIVYLVVARRLRRAATDLVKVADDLDAVRVGLQPKPRKPERNAYMRRYHADHRKKVPYAGKPSP
jgi:hypothetical protein